MNRLILVAAAIAFALLLVPGCSEKEADISASAISDEARPLPPKPHRPAPSQAW